MTGHVSPTLGQVHTRLRLALGLRFVITRRDFILGGSGNYVKMIHNGIEYGDMQVVY